MEPGTSDREAGCYLRESFKQSLRSAKRSSPFSVRSRRILRPGRASRSYIRRRLRDERVFLSDTRRLCFPTRNLLGTVKTERSVTLRKGVLSGKILLRAVRHASGSAETRAILVDTEPLGIHKRFGIDVRERKRMAAGATSVRELNDIGLIRVTR